jgi:hypothetical protein
MDEETTNTEEPNVERAGDQNPPEPETPPTGDVPDPSGPLTVSDGDAAPERKPGMRLLCINKSGSFPVPGHQGKRIQFSGGFLDLEIEAEKLSLDAEELRDAVEKLPQYGTRIFEQGDGTNPQKPKTIEEIPLRQISVTGHDANALRHHFKIFTVEGLARQARENRGALISTLVQSTADLTVPNGKTDADKAALRAKTTFWDRKVRDAEAILQKKEAEEERKRKAKEEAEAKRNKKNA